MVQSSRQTTTLETGSKIATIDNRAGRVFNSSGNCCVMGCGDFAVVPAVLIQEGSEVFFLTSHKRGAEVVTHLVANGIALVAEIDGDVACHEVEPLLVEALGRKVNCVNVALHDNRLYVVIMQRGNLLMANRYRVATNEDVLYHVMNAYEKFGMDVLRDPLYVCGKIDTTLLMRYVGNICG